MTIQLLGTELLWTELLQQLRAHLTLLPDKPEETAENTLKALWLTAAGTPQSAVKAESTPLPELNATQIDTLNALITQRGNGMPLAHLTGRQHFMGLEMLAGPEALVPRRETELLAQAARSKAIELATGNQTLTYIDICTGSGNIALAVAQHLTQQKFTANIFGADLSEEAVALARRNALALNLPTVEFRAGDLLAPFETSEFLGKVDLLTCNPPYINQAKVEQMPAEISAHEPRLAFDGGPFGVAILMRLLEEAPRYIRSGGWLIFEVGLGQGPALIKRMQRNAAFQTLETVCDDAGAVRAICVSRA